MIVLYNTNKYLGGGETLLVRFSEYLQAADIEFAVVCASGSYIEKSIRNDVNCIALDCDANYYYLSNTDRKKLLNELEESIGWASQVKFVTFCMRDLHAIAALSKVRPGLSITHLVLHIQDDLYTGQTLVDKLRYKMTGTRQFHNYENIDFNRSLLKSLERKGGLICMAEVIAKYWSNQFQISIARERIVPLPSFVKKQDIKVHDANNRSILWLGRLVDFKMPAVLAMIRFLSINDAYKLTIVGSGDSESIRAAMEAHNVASSRVQFIGQLGYEAIGAEIAKHSIGYGMGTSLVELAMYKIPTIVALASYDHKEFEDAICGGLFFDQPLGCDGSELILGSEATNVTTLQKAFDAIESDYARVAEKCHYYAEKNYFLNENFRRYVDIISNADEFDLQNSERSYPQCSPLRRVLFKASTPQ